jgi:hypothetical protein
MPYADRAFNDASAAHFEATGSKSLEFTVPLLAIRRITVHLHAVNERTLFA